MDSLYYITDLREQIKVNAAILFGGQVKLLHGVQSAFDIAVMACPAAHDAAPSYFLNEKSVSRVLSDQLQIQAVLMYAASNFSNGTRKLAIAAKGPPRSDTVTALEGLLLVLATALTNVEDSLCKGVSKGIPFGGGVVDYAMISK